MPKTRFTGRVFPAALNVSILDQPPISWKADELGLDMTFRVQIQNGSIVIDCDVNKFDESAHLVPLFMRACDIARATVDLAAFVTGNGLSVILDTFTDPGGTTMPLAAQQPSVAALATAVELGTGDFDKILRILLAEPPLFLALRDLVEALTFPHRAAVNCARAIRALRPYFGPAGSPEAGLLALRDKLQISRSYLQTITRPVPIEPREQDQGPNIRTEDILRRAWTVMNRFFEYRKRGGQPLPLSEFPLLM